VAEWWERGKQVEARRCVWCRRVVAVKGVSTVEGK